MNTPDPAACPDLEVLLPAYAEGSLPAAEAARVAAHLATCPGCQHHVAQLRALIDELDMALPAVPRTAVRTNFLALLAQEKARLPEAAAAAPSAAKTIALWPLAGASTWLRVAASLVLLAAGVLLGRQLPWPRRGSADLATRSANSAAPAALAQALAGNEGRAASASDRIRLVNGSTEQSAPGDPAVQVLINTLNFDPNPNVRLAACEALYRLRADPRVGTALVHSLPLQTDPNVQITLIDLLVALRVPRAVPQLERLAQRPDALPVVRAQAEAGIGKLI